MQVNIQVKGFYKQVFSNINNNTKHVVRSE